MKTQFAKTCGKVFRLSALLAVPALAQANTSPGVEKQSDNDMAQVSNFIGAPIQNNFDFAGGPNDNSFQYKVNVQPMIPFALNENWNLITRTIMPKQPMHPSWR